jgi:hypothetical protein
MVARLQMTLNDGTVIDAIHYHMNATDPTAIMSQPTISVHTPHGWIEVNTSDIAVLNSQPGRPT